MAGNTAVIEGVAEARRKFSDLEAKAQRSVLRQAAKRAAKPVVEEAKRRAPVDSSNEGDLAGSIGSKSRTRKGEIIIDVSYGKDEFWGLYQELGTAHHAAQPFLRPALDNNEQEVVDAFAGELAKVIRKVTKGR